MANTQGKGWFRTRKQSKDEFVLYCYYAQHPGTGERKERFHKLGLVSDFPDEASRWKEVGRLGLGSFIDNPLSPITFGDLVARYMNSGAINRKTLSQQRATGTVSTLRHNLEDYCMPRWGTTPVVEIRTKAVEEWFLYLNQKPLEWPTIGKIKQAMQGVFKYGRKEELLPSGFNPFRDIDCEASTGYEALTCTPEQTLAILQQLEGPEFILALVIAATALTISEALGLQWADIEYDRSRISVRRSWVQEVGNCKNSYRKAPVAMHPVLATYLKEWQAETPYSRPSDWVFASNQLKGAKPRSGGIASQRYLYPAAARAGVFTAVPELNKPHDLRKIRYVDHSGNPVKRWGWHNLRHSLATWLVSSGVDVKTVASMLRHSGPRLVLERYAHAVDANKLAAQGRFLESLRLPDIGAA